MQAAAFPLSADDAEVRGFFHRAGGEGCCRLRWGGGGKWGKCGKWGLAHAEDDATFGEVVGGELYGHFVAAEDADVVLAYFAGDVGDDLVPVF